MTSAQIAEPTGFDADGFIDAGNRPAPILVRKCEFCGKRRKVTSTTFVCNYCARCHALCAGESQDAIGELKGGTP